VFVILDSSAYMDMGSNTSSVLSSTSSVHELDDGGHASSGVSNAYMESSGQGSYLPSVQERFGMMGDF
jgi:hypothetical protein